MTTVRCSCAARAAGPRRPNSPRRTSSRSRSRSPAGGASLYWPCPCTYPRAGSVEADRRRQVREDCCMRRLFPILLLLVSGCTPFPTPQPAGGSPSAPDRVVPSEAGPGPAQGRPDATLQAEAGNPARMEAVATITASAAPRLAEVLPSPDGAWRAEVYAYDSVEVAPG